MTELRGLPVARGKVPYSSSKIKRVEASRPLDGCLYAKARRTGVLPRSAFISDTAGARRRASAALLVRSRANQLLVTGKLNFEIVEVILASNGRVYLPCRVRNINRGVHLNSGLPRLGCASPLHEMARKRIQVAL
jgi:hypothetical protein